jgi:hypothetical protein
VIDARDKLAGLIRHAIEDEARLELVTSPGKPTPRGGYDTTWMYVQNGTATSMTIEAAWYPGSASFTLSGPAVEQADEAFFAARRLHRGQKNVSHGPLQCPVFVPYADGGRVELLRAVLPALLAPCQAETTADSPGLHVTVAAPDGTEQRYRVSGDETLTVLVEGQPVLGVDRHGPGRWIGDEWRRLYPADRVVDRSVAIEGIATEAQWHDLERAAGLNQGDLGRFRQWAVDRPTILFEKNYGTRSCDLDAAVEWARRQGLPYEDEQRVRSDPGGSHPPGAPAIPGPEAAVTGSTTFPGPPAAGAVTGDQPRPVAPGTAAASRRAPRRGR